MHDDRQFHLRTSSLLTVGDLYNVISSLNSAWMVKFRLTLMWLMPTTPNFVRFISVMAERQGIILQAPDRGKAIGNELIFNEHVRRLAGRLNVQRILMFTMRAAPCSDDDDGFHYCSEFIDPIMANVEEYFLSKHPEEPPCLLGKPKSIQHRWSTAERCRRH